MTKTALMTTTLAYTVVLAVLFLAKRAFSGHQHPLVK